MVKEESVAGGGNGDLHLRSDCETVRRRAMMNESDRELSFVKSKMYQQSASLSSAAAFLLCLGNSMALFGGDTGIEHQTQSLSSLYSLNHVYQIYVQQNR